MAAEMPSLWEDGAFDRLTERGAAVAAPHTRRIGFAIQGQGQ